MADKTHPYTSKLSYSDNGSSYTDLSDMRLVTPPNMERGDGEITVLDSPGMAREYIASWIEGGEIPFEVRMHKTQLAALLALFALPPTTATKYWKITLPLLAGETTASTLVARGHLKRLGLSDLTVDGDDVVAVPCAVKVSGLPTFTPGS